MYPSVLPCLKLLFPFLLLAWSEYTTTLDKYKCLSLEYDSVFNPVFIGTGCDLILYKKWPRYLQWYIFPHFLSISSGSESFWMVSCVTRLSTQLLNTGSGSCSSEREQRIIVVAICVLSKCKKMFKYNRLLIHVRMYRRVCAQLESLCYF